MIGLTDNFHYVTSLNPLFLQLEKSIGRSRKTQLHYMTTSSSLLMATTVQPTGEEYWQVQKTTNNPSYLTDLPLSTGSDKTFGR